MRAREIQPKKLVVFDIDDTLVNTQTKVHVIKDGKIVKSLNSHDFTHYKLQPGESFDFEDFRNAREFFEKSKPIIPMMRQLKQDIATGNKVVMVTARADFDDKELFLDTFRKYGVDIDKVHVYRAGNSKQGTTEERKKAIIKNLLDKDDYSKAIMYDDAKPNLHTFIELKQDHPRTKFYAWHVSPEGAASEYMREGVVAEKKKRRRRPRWAAYGPGPFGGYGYAVGYSGDSGGDGGVGENYTDEGWKDIIAGATLGAAALGAQGKPIIVQQHVEPGDTVYSIARQNNVDPKEIMKLNNFNNDTKLKKGQMVKVPDYSKPIDIKPKDKNIKYKDKETKLDISNTVTGTSEEALLRKYAGKANIKGAELVAFLSQIAHETMNFKHMVEIGNAADFKKYDPLYFPGKAKQLGNVRPGDGEKYKGRGFIQLTGRYNYSKAGEALGLPLEQKPELVERPDVAAKVAIWYWKNRVQPNVNNFKDIKDVTKPINPGLKGIEDRKEKFKTFMLSMQ